MIKLRTTHIYAQQNNIQLQQNIPVPYHFHNSSHDREKNTHDVKGLVKILIELKHNTISKHQGEQLNTISIQKNVPPCRQQTKLISNIEYFNVVQTYDLSSGVAV